MTWHETAACRGMDTSLFFPGFAPPSPLALAACARCPVRAECVADAQPGDESIRGGMTAAQRDKARRAAGAARTAERRRLQRRGCVPPPAQVSTTRTALLTTLAAQPGGVWRGSAWALLAAHPAIAATGSALAGVCRAAQVAGLVDITTGGPRGAWAAITLTDTGRAWLAWLDSEAGRAWLDVAS